MDGPKVVVTLVCTHADEDQVDDIVDGLRASGRSTKLVVGLEQQPRLIAKAIEACGEWGLVVLCASPRLSEDTRRKAEGMFSARRGPNHAMVRIELGQSVGESVAAISRAYEGFVSSRGRIGRRSIDDDSPKLREVVSMHEGTPGTKPLMRLELGDQREDDRGAQRVAPMAATAKAKELSRRGRVAREQERERARKGLSKARMSTAPRDEFGLEMLGPRAALQRDGERLDRMMIVLLIGAGLLAVFVALGLSG